MECTRCKTRNNYYHSFCYKCGAELESIGDNAIQKEQPHDTSRVLLNKRREMFNPYKEKKQYRKRILLAALISGTAVLCVACWMIFNS